MRHRDMLVTSISKCKVLKLFPDHRCSPLRSGAILDMSFYRMMPISSQHLPVVCVEQLVANFMLNLGIFNLYIELAK